MTTRPVSPALHIVHVVICFATFGFIFPHALMENIDAEKIKANAPGEPPPIRSDKSV